MEELIPVLTDMVELLSENAGQVEICVEQYLDILQKLQSISESLEVIVSYLSVASDLIQCIGGFIFGSLLASVVIKGIKI